MTNALGQCQMEQPLAAPASALSDCIRSPFSHALFQTAGDYTLLPQLTSVVKCKLGE